MFKTEFYLFWHSLYVWISICSNFLKIFFHLWKYFTICKAKKNGNCQALSWGWQGRYYFITILEWRTPGWTHWKEEKVESEYWNENDDCPCRLQCDGSCTSSTDSTSTTLGGVVDSLKLEFWLEDLYDIAEEENVEDENRDDRNCEEDDTMTLIHPTQFILIL